MVLPPNNAPLRYLNLTTMDGNTYIAPTQPEAGIIHWIFLQLAKNISKMTEIRRMAATQGFHCSSSNFSKLIRNPVYCGLIPVVLGDNEKEMVKGNNQPLISTSIFYRVQDIINTKVRGSKRSEELKDAFFLTGFLICPLCCKRI